MTKIDKKQLPQLIALIVLSVGVFGFFIVRMIAPTPAAAQAPGAAKSASAADAAKHPVAETVDAPVPAPEPTATMRDPFLPSIADAEAVASYQRAQSAAAPQQLSPRQSAPRNLTGRRFGRQAPSMQAMSIPMVAPLPNLGAPSGSGVQSGQPMPVTAPPAAPVTWSVTGVLGGDDGVAILRDGESRRIVKQGDVLSGGLRVQHIGRGSVTLERDGQNYRLPLGGPKDTPKPNDASKTNETSVKAPDLAPAAETPAAPAAP